MRIRRVPTEVFPPVKVATSGRGGSAASRRAGRRRSTTGRRGVALRGARLASAAHPVAVRLDPQRRGVGPRVLEAALLEAGVAIGGADPYMTVYAMLNSATQHFERGGRGQYRWRDLAADET